MWNSSLAEELTSAVATLDRSSNSKTPRKYEGQHYHIAQIPVTKVSQLDGQLLDDELQTLIKSQLDNVFKHLPQYSGLVARIQPEIKAFVRFLLWTFSHRNNTASPGNALQNLRYRNELKYSNVSVGGKYLPMLLKIHGDEPTRLQRVLHGVGTVLIPYAFDRIQNRAMISQWSSLPEDDYRYIVNKWLDTLEKIWSAAQVLNLFVFLYNGKYRSVLDRILFLRLVYDKAEGGRNVAFEFINQQLLYDGFSEMLIALLPMIDWARIQRAGLRLQAIIFSLFSTLRKKLPVLTVGGNPLTCSGEQADKSDKDVEGFKDIRKKQTRDESMVCAFCTEETCMPYILGCGHYYCYYCLQSHYMSNNNLTCHTCNTLVTTSHRV
uniref:RING-type E3 ubiquitin transferase (cysteine targeting) n=1 Tax=Aplanochytrium stocchinoi TaxID=215587 RepID=A0A7S3PF55_9STRA